MSFNSGNTERECYYFSGGGCRWGTTCRYLHGGVPANFSATQYRESTPECMHHNYGNGTCYRGDNCRYRHSGVSQKNRAARNAVTTPVTQPTTVAPIAATPATTTTPAKKTTTLTATATQFIPQKKSSVVVPTTAGRTVAGTAPLSPPTTLPPTQLAATQPAAQPQTQSHPTQPRTDTHSQTQPYARGSIRRNPATSDQLLSRNRRTNIVTPDEFLTSVHKLENKVNSALPQLNAALQRTKEAISSKAKVIPIVKTTFDIPASKAYKTSVSSTEYEIEAFLTRYQSEMVTHRKLLFFKLRDLFKEISDEIHDFIPDVMVNEILSFIPPAIDMDNTIFTNSSLGYQNIRHRRYLTHNGYGKNVNCGDKILRTTKQCAILYQRSKRNSVPMFWEHKIANNEAHPRLIDDSDAHPWLIYDLGQISQIAGVCIYCEGIISCDSDYLLLSVPTIMDATIACGDNLSNDEWTNECRLDVKHKTGWNCYVGLDIHSRYIQLTFNGSHGKINQIAFI